MGTAPSAAAPQPTPAVPPLMAAPTDSPDGLGPGSGPRRFWPWIAASVTVVAIVVVALTLAELTRSPPVTITYTEYFFEWETPPSSFCPNFSISSPGAPFTVDASQTFNVSWYLTCTSGGPTTISWVNIANEYFGTGSDSGTFVSSNLPVTIYSGNYTYFNITCTAPSTSYDGQLAFMVDASSP
jgi:hypothetical protein